MAYELSFDGVDDYVDMCDDTNIDTATEITIEEWLKPQSVSAYWASYIAKLESGTYNGFNISAQSDASRVRFHGLGGDNSVSGAVVIGEWVHVAAVYDGTQMLLYLDGVLQGTTPIASANLANNEPLKLGMLHYYGEYTGSSMRDIK